MSDQTVTLRINATSDKAVAATRAVKTELDGLGKAAGSAGQQATRGGRGIDQMGDAAARTEKRIAALGGTVGRVKGFITAFAGAFASVQTIRGAAALADTYSDIVGKLSQVTKGERELATAKATTFAISQRYYQQLDATVTLYSRAAGALAQYKVSQEGVAALTETINAGLLVSRATAAESASAVLQLSQALGAGALRGEEFNAVNEAAPRLMQALADSLGRPRGELKKLAEDGKLTVDVLLKAWTGPEAQKIIEEATKVPLTIGRAWQLVRNQLTRYIGEADQAGGTSASIAQAIKAIGTNLPQIIGGLVTLAKVTAAWFLLFRGVPAVVVALRSVRDMYVGIALAQTMGIRSSGIWAAATIANIMTVKAAAGLLFAAFAGWQIGKYLRENFLEARLAGIALVNGLMKGWATIKEGAQIMWAAITSASGAAFNAMRGSLADFIGMNARAAELIPDMFGGAVVVGGLRALEGQLRTTGDASTSFAAKLIEIRNAADAERAQIDAITGDMADYEIAQWQAKNASDEASSATQDFNIELGNLGKTSKKTKDELARLAEAQRQFGRENERIAAQLAGPIAEAEFDYADGVAQANEALAKREATVAQVIEREKLLAEQKRRTIDQIQREQDIIGQVVADYTEQIRLSGMSAEARRVEEEVIRAKNDAIAAGRALSQGEIDDLRMYIAESQRIIDFNEAQQAAAQDYRRVWTGAIQSVGAALGDWVTGGIRKFSDFGRALKDIARRALSDVIAQFTNNSLVPAIGNWLRQLTSGGFASAGQQGGGFFGQLLQGAGNMLGRIFGGGAASAQAAGTLGGFGNNVGALADLPGAAMPARASLAMSPWLGAGLGALAGFQMGGDLPGKALAGASYGALGFGAMKAWGAYSAATAGGAGVGSALISGLKAIGPAAWVALGAIAIDKISGGKLFGTSYKADSAARQFSIGDDGASGFTSTTQVKQRSLFRGRKWKTTTTALDSEAQAQINELFDAVMGSVGDAAAMLGVEAPALVAGTFRQEFDKNGNLKKEFATIAGQVYNEGQEAFAARLLGENLLAVAKVAGGAEEIERLAGDYRTSGETLQGFATLMLAVQSDIKNATQLWTASGEGVLTSVVQAMERLAKGGEELVETYQRVTGVAREYGQLIGGVESQLLTNGLNEYQRAQLDIEMGYRAQVKQANELAKSLGLTGARAEDLAKIEQLRAVNMASLQKQMEAQKNTFLQDLGLSDLSPLRDSEKLAESMQLLRDAAGAGDMQRAQQLSQQVLGFGRNLYASGADYNALYGQVTGLLNGMSPGTLEGFTETGLDNIADILEGLPDKFAQAIFQQAANITPLPLPPTTPTTPPPGGTTSPQPPGGLTDEGTRLLREILAALQRAGALQEMDSLNSRVNAL